MSETTMLDRQLAETDPEIHLAIRAELARQQDTLEMIASENFAPLARHAGPGLGTDQQVRRGLPRPPLLRRLRARRRHRAAGHRPRQGPVRRRVRQRAAALRRAGQRRRAVGAARTRATPSSGWTWPTAATSPTACGSTSPASCTTSSPTTSREDDYRIDMDEVERLAVEHRPKVIIAGWSAYPRHLDFAEFRAHRRRGRRLPDGRHGALRRPRRRRPAPHPGAARPRRHDHDAQDPRRPTRRRHPDQRRRPGQEDQLRRLPRAAGRPARARHRGQGRGLQARRRPRSSASASSAPSTARASWPSACSPTTCARRGSPC